MSYGDIGTVVTGDLLKATSSANSQPLCMYATGLRLLRVTGDTSKTGNSCLALHSYSFAMHNNIQTQLFVMNLADSFSWEESAP